MTGLSTPEDEAEYRTAAIVALLAECGTAQEQNSVIRVALRAEFMWRCHPCKQDHYLTNGFCACGAGRPAELPG